MPEISPLGWFHTIIGILALISGVYTLVKYKVIETGNKSAQIFLGTTFIAAATSLMIYARGPFGEMNPAHYLGILTLLALTAGTIVEKTQMLGKLSPYFQAMSFSALFLFHMIPAITDGLMRLPTSDPIVKNIEDPLLLGFYLAFLILYVIGFAAQVLWLRRQATA